MNSVVIEKKRIDVLSFTRKNHGEPEKQKGGDREVEERNFKLREKFQECGKSKMWKSYLLFSLRQENGTIIIIG